jgi:hypothetical protein
MNICIPHFIVAPPRSSGAELPVIRTAESAFEGIPRLLRSQRQPGDYRLREASRYHPSKLPTRLAVGLGLGSDLTSGYPLLYAPAQSNNWAFGSPALFFRKEKQPRLQLKYCDLISKNQAQDFSQNSYKRTIRRKSRNQTTRLRQTKQNSATLHLGYLHEYSKLNLSHFSSPLLSHLSSCLSFTSSCSIFLATLSYVEIPTIAHDP